MGPATQVSDGARPRVAHGKLLLASMAVVVGGLVAVFSVDGDEVIYSYRVEEALRLGDVGDRRMRMAGYLVHGTLRQPQRCQWTFRMSDSPGLFADATAPSGPSLLIEYEGCPLPSTIGDAPGLVLEISAEGHWQGTPARGRFLADRLLTKCPAKYEPGATRASCAGAPGALR